jgi:hypothetical protein
MTTELAPRTHNLPPEMVVFEEIDDLFCEATNWADGHPIESEEVHEACTKLYDRLHDAGKRADKMRAEEKKPFDDGAKAVQAKYKPPLTKVDQGKAALGELLAAWRKRVADEKAAEATRKAAEAARIAKEAEDAIRASSGSLAARVEAEELLAHSKSVERDARHSEKAATTGLGLRTVWRAELVDEAEALDWAYSRDPAAFKALVQGMADGVVRGGVRSVPGFRVFDEKVAR